MSTTWGKTTWIKSSQSGDASGVEVAFFRDDVIVREADRPLRPALHFTHEAWAAFLEDVRRGQFDAPVR